jgi:hypothetical protein
VFRERTNHKVKFNNRTGTEVPEGEWWYAYILYSISVVVGVSVVKSCTPATLTPGYIY